MTTRSASSGRSPNTLSPMRAGLARVWRWLWLFSLLAGLYLTSLYSYLLFHSLAEIFSVVVACAVFLFAWNARRFLSNDYLLFVGITSLYVALIDVLHTLAFKGMGVFTGYDANLPTQLWIAARYLQSTTLLAAPLFLHRRLNAYATIGVFAVLTALLLGTIFIWRIFPACYIEGVGLTPFKINSEYLIILILLASAGGLYRQREKFDRRVLQLLLLAIGATIAAELAFTTYVSVYAPANMLGHLFKIAAYVLLYRAIVETGLQKPYDLMFHDLNLSRTALQQVNAILEQRVAERTAELKRANQHLSTEITDRKRAEAALRESETKYRIVADNTYDWEFWSDAEGQFIYVSPSCERITGYPADKFMADANLLDRIIHPDDLPGYYRHRREVTESPAPGQVEFRVLRPDGAWRWIEHACQPVFDDEGRFQGTRGNNRDITGRKQAEQALQESEARYRSTLDNMMEGCQIIGFDWRYRYANDAVARHGRIGRDELLGRTMMEVYPGIEQTELFAVLQRCMVERVPAHMENQFAYPDGATGRFELSIQPVPEGIFILSNDITERKRAEGEVRARNTELATLFSLSARLREARTADEILPLALSEVLGQLKADGGALVLLDPNNGHFTVARAEGFLAPNAGFVFPAEQGLSGQVLQTRQPYVSADMAAEPTRLRSLKNGERVGPVALVPIQSEVEVLGVLIVAREHRLEVRSFTAAEVHLLSAIGEMVGNALRRARLFDEAERRLRRTEALRAIDTAITSSLDLRLTFSVILEQTTTQLRADAADILLMEPLTQTLEYAAGRGFRAKGIERSRLRLGEGHGGRAALERRTVNVPNLAEAADFVRAPLIRGEGFFTYWAAPLIAKGQVVGALEIFHRAPLQPDPEWVSFLETLAGQAAIAIEDARLFEALQRSNLELTLAYEATIEGWSRALDLRDRETEGHTQRVTEVAVQLARAFGVSEQEIAHMRRGALLHDIGKMGVPDAILLKPGPLTEDEWTVMRLHPQFAYDMLSPIAYLKPALGIPYCHHEKWDGTGYPRGLKGEQIPLPARLFAVADVWDALRSNRPYRSAWPEEEVREHIRAGAGTHFDPQAVEVFLRNVDL